MLFWRKSRIVYIIEDNVMFRRTIDLMIQRQYHLKTFGFGSFESCMESMGNNPHIILLDHMLPGMTGLEALPLLRQKWPAAQIIVISSLQDTHTALKILKTGICDYIEKEAYCSETLYGSINKAFTRLNITAPVKKNASLPSQNQLGPGYIPPFNQIGHI